VVIAGRGDPAKALADGEKAAALDPRDHDVTHQDGAEWIAPGRLA